ncbi:MAG: protein phosphatase 2C domain-containing protein [Kiloniellales bacterium]|nr:protein phosphatase 2C domain-containing protein [Kiloniellales bacterium]
MQGALRARIDGALGPEREESVLHSDLQDPSGPVESFLWRAAGISHVGTRRRVNEDAHLQLVDRSLFVVADGMGGHEAGDVASRLVVDRLRDLPPVEDMNTTLRLILERLQSANAELRAYAQQHSRSGVVGTTVAALIGFEGRCACLWAGDSRVYLLRGGAFKQITRDHSQVEELISLGLVERADAETHPAGNVITRAVGADEELAVDVVTRRVLDRDTYLICSDGLNKAVPEAEIAEVLSAASYEEAAEELIRRALNHGASDNVTVVVARAEKRGPGPAT